MTATTPSTPGGPGLASHLIIERANANTRDLRRLFVAWVATLIGLIVGIGLLTVALMWSDAADAHQLGPQAPASPVLVAPAATIPTLPVFVAVTDFADPTDQAAPLLGLRVAR